MKKALIVDDNEQNLYLLQTMLKGQAYDVMTAANGVEALEKARRSAPDIIISDILMPVMDGFRLCRKVKTDETLRHIPFVIYTATYTGPKDEVFAIKIGADRFIQKPCEPDALMDAIHDVMVAAKGRHISSASVPVHEEEIYKLYSERLVRKLEQKMLELKKEVQARRESEERFKTLFELAPDAICLFDLESRIIDVNVAAEALTGLRKEELIGKKFLEHGFIAQDKLLKSSGFLEKIAQGLPVGPDEQIIKRKDGKQLFVEMRAFPLAIRGQNMVISIVRDVTERKSMEEQLRQSQKLEAIGRLSGGIAHDFNNLLTTIIGNAELALADIPNDDPVREEIEEIKAAGERAASLTLQLLAFSRKQVLRPMVINLNETALDMEKMLYRMIGEDIELKTILAPDLGQVEADPGQIEQVIMNLVVNARDAMPAGGKITLETGNVAIGEEYAHAHISVKPGSYVMLSVSDTGTGMSREVQDRIFEPFFTTKEKEKGTGLGLSTVYGIVKQSNGNIWVYSEPWKGTTFKIYLPRVEKPISEIERKAERTQTITGSETILVVEDDEMVCNFIVKVLEQYGYKVLTAANGDDAIKVSGEYQGQIHLMLTDVIMPGISSRDMEKSLKSSRPEMRVLYMSGYTDNTIVHHGVLDPGKAFIGKPFSPESLGRKMREVFDWCEGEKNE